MYILHWFSRNTTTGNEFFESGITKASSDFNEIRQALVDEVDNFELEVNRDNEGEQSKFTFNTDCTVAEFKTNSDNDCEFFICFAISEI